MSSYRKLCTAFVLAMNVFAFSASAETPEASITVSSTSQRGINDQLMIGFNAPWGAIQGGFYPSSIWDSNAAWIRQDVLNFMEKSVPGAYYRYPGGTASNYFRWKEAIGTSRISQVYPSWPGTLYPTFGFDEFVEFAKSVKGLPIITINLTAVMDGDYIDFEATAQEAADWVEYANSPSDGSTTNPGGGTDWAELRATNGHAASYNIKYWELGNELDISLSKRDYIAACKKCIEKMKAIDPNIKVIAHAASAPWAADPTYYERYNFYWYTWHQELLDEEGVGEELEGIAFHPYYYSTYGMISYMNQIWSDCQSYFPQNPPRIFNTEHARWFSDMNRPATTSAIGVSLTMDFMLYCLSHTENTMSIYHAFAGTGPWLLFNDVDESGTQYTSNHCLRPLAHAWKLYGRNIYGKEVKQTSVTSSNYCGYSGNYDIRGIGLQDKDGAGQLVAAINRYTSPLLTIVTFPGITSGSYAGRLEYVGGDDEGNSGILSRYVNSNSNSEFIFNMPKVSVATLRVLGGNYVINPSFEDSLLNWSLRNGSDSTGSLTLESDGGDSGSNKYIQLAKSSGSIVSAVQTQGNNPALGNSGFVANNLTDRFIFTAMCRGNNLDSNGAKLKLQFFDGTGTYTGLNSVDKINNDDSGWKSLSMSFIPADVIAAGSTFGRMELCLQNTSDSGSVDCDTVALIHQPNLLLNGSFEGSFLNGVPGNWIKSTGTTTQETSGTRHGLNCVKLSGSTQLYQTTGANPTAFGPSGLIASRPFEYFTIKGWAKTSNKTIGSALLWVQVWQRPMDGGSATYVAGPTSNSVTTANTTWTKLTVPSFRVQDYLSGGYQLDHLVVVLVSTGDGDVYFDSIGMYPDYDIDINDCIVSD